MECGTKVGGDESSIATLISGIVSILFYISVLVLVASPFVDRAPSFTFCVFVSCALLFIMRTAKESAQKVRKR